MSADSDWTTLCDYHAAMSSACADFEFNCYLSFYLTTILSWRHGPLIHQAQHKETMLGLPMSSVLQRGHGKCDHPLMTLGYPWQMQPRHWDCLGSKVSRCMWHTSLKKFIEAALCFTHLDPSSIYFSGYIHRRPTPMPHFHHTRSGIFSSVHVTDLTPIPSEAVHSWRLLCTNMSTHQRTHQHS